MRYTVFVNGRLDRDRPSEGALEAIVAHELEHICWYRDHSRWRWVGLIGLMSERQQEAFEKDADRGAIHRGYGAGLAEYRRWLYQHITAKAAERKRRVYLTPEEIEGVSSAGGADTQ